MADPTEMGEKAVNAAQSFLKRGQEVAKRETRIIRLQTQISRLRTQRGQLFQQMGEKVFDLFERDLVKNQDLRMMCQQVKGLDAEMETKREEIEQLRRPDTRGEYGIDGETVQAKVEYLDEEDESIRD
jgi:predicted RNase H-like nuclease (RuvC/YqgF family)